MKTNIAILSLEILLGNDLITYGEFHRALFPCSLSLVYNSLIYCAIIRLLSITPLEIE